MRDIKRSARVMAQALQVRAWEVEQQRALVRETALALSHSERRERDIETEIQAIGEHARLQLSQGRALDVVRLHQTRLHGEEWQRNLQAAVDETARASHRYDDARDALSTVFAEHEALDSRRQALLAELEELSLKRTHREQDERYAARVASHRSVHGQD